METTFYHKDLKVEKTKTPKEKAKDKTTLKFGASFTDHMLTIEYHKGAWEAPKIVPLQNLSLHPAASSLHYALECFEGMKVYKGADGKIKMFRPMKNLSRMRNSGIRLGLPAFDPEELLKCLQELLRIEESWVPEGKGYSLYLRPTYISTYAHVGVAPPQDALLYIILSPVGPYFPTGFRAVSLLASDKYVRAWPGGTGYAKLGGNYGGTIVPQMEAIKQGYSQILWLFNGECTEVGTMNFLLVWKNKAGKTEVITAPLDDLILPGVTRDSVLTILRGYEGIEVVEKRFTIDEVMEASKEGRLIEAFGTGTACVVQPVSLIHYKDTDIKIPLDPKDPSSQMGPLAKRVYDDLAAIQYGEKPHEWCVSL